MSDNWTLTPGQIAWMDAHKEAINEAYLAGYWGNRGLMHQILARTQADGYRDMFGNMPWDKAYDRYESQQAEG